MLELIEMLLNQLRMRGRHRPDTGPRDATCTGAGVRHNFKIWPLIEQSPVAAGLCFFFSIPTFVLFILGIVFFNVSIDAQSTLRIRTASATGTIVHCTETLQTSTSRRTDSRGHTT